VSDPYPIGQQHGVTGRIRRRCFRPRKHLRKMKLFWSGPKVRHTANTPRSYPHESIRRGSLTLATAMSSELMPVGILTVP
jgi:hypothetical protein